MYKKFFLGMVWMFILFIFVVIIWVIFNGVGVVNLGEIDILYFVYVLFSIFIWGFFLEVYKLISIILIKNGCMLIMFEVFFELLFV